MIIFYILFVLLCCYITYKYACYQFIKLDKTNQKGFDMHQETILKLIDEVGRTKKAVIKIQKDIYR